SSRKAATIETPEFYLKAWQVLLLLPTDSKLCSCQSSNSEGIPRPKWPIIQ
ncbi:hypothetical protein PoMZ_04912, partial [Pyricularia oryzae]